MERQKGQGRPPEIADDLKENIARTARRKLHRSSKRKLGNQYKVAKTTINKILTEKEFKFGSVKKTKEFSENQKKERVDFCRDMLKSKGKKIYNTIFSDEMGISL